MRQREELEFRLRKFEASARKANDKLVSGLFQLNTYHAARVSRIVNIVLGTVDNVKLSSFPCSMLISVFTVYKQFNKKIAKPHLLIFQNNSILNNCCSKEAKKQLRFLKRR